jgi:benzoylformate decarboxylase
MATGKVSFFLCASQGIENMALNLNNCLTDQVPIIVATPGGDHNVLEPYTAWRGSLTSADAAPETLRRAMKFAVTPPGAPVALNISGNAQLRKGKAPVFKMDAVKERPIFRAPADAVEKVARGLIEAKSPAFLVGREVTRGGSVEAMVKLAEKLSIPVFQSQRKDNLYCDFPTDHPLFMENFLAPVRFPPVIDMFVNLGAGRQGNDPTAGGDGEDFGRGAPPKVDSTLKYVHVSFNADQLEGPLGGYDPILADVPSTIQDLSNAIDGLLTKDRADRIRQERLEVVKGYHEQRKKSREAVLKAVFDEAPISWERVGYELELALDKNAVIVPELGSQDQKVHQFLTCGPNAKTRFGRTIGGQLGWGLGAAFGVQLGMPDRQVCTILGDGGFLFGQSQGLWSLSRYQAPILVVIMNNHSYNEIRVRNMVASVGGRQFETGQELVSYLGDPDVDFAKVAEGFGVKGEKVRDPKDLAAAIQRGIKVMRDGRPYMLDVEAGSEGIMADSKWHPGFTIAGLRKA